MVLKGGVLAIGSLFWETEKNCIDKKLSKELAKYRRIWRENNFEKESLQIDVPIRYGRKSSTRVDTYTMVFSNDIVNENYGKGKILKYLKPANSFEEIEIQAIEVAIAEGIFKEYNNRRIICNWGSVGLLLNPKLKEVKKGIYYHLVEKWTNLYLSYRNTINNSKYRLGEEEPTISPNGFLNINVDLGELDYLLATPVEINLKAYPKPGLIAHRINTSDYLSYFFENRKNGIITFNDDDIIKELLKPHKIKLQSIDQSTTGRHED